MNEYNTLYLLDANLYIYRAFYALPNLTTNKGIPTGAIYGFLQLLTKIKKNIPKFMGIVYDTKEPTFRHQLYPLYKNNRPIINPNLKKQIPLIKEIITAMNIAAIEIKGFEADDIIATLTKQALQKKFRVVLISNDKDFFQLLNSKVIIWNIAKNIYLNANDIEKKIGIKPNRIVEYMALTGDIGDNIPGVPGIGPKTAANLITEYHDIDNLFNKINNIKSNKIMTKLLANRKLIFLNRKLVLLRNDVPIIFEPETFKIKKLDTNILLSIFNHLEITNISKSLLL